MIRYVLKTDESARAVRKAYEERVDGPTDRAAERIAKARFAVYGTSVYPDATFSLRLSYGRVAGWTYRGRTVPALTNFDGLYRRVTGHFPFALPQRWLDAKEQARSLDRVQHLERERHHRRQFRLAADQRAEAK